VNGRPMTDDKYINRLIDWIVNQTSLGGTLKDVITADLEDFGNRIDAFDDAGHKGAHAEVTKYEASRFITGAYLLIGDILNLWAEVEPLSVDIEIKANITATAEVIPSDVEISNSDDDTDGQSEPTTDSASDFSA
jgi:hypothetical protein